MAKHKKGFFDQPRKGFLWHSENLELVFEEQEKLEIIFLMLKELDVYKAFLSKGYDTYQGCCNLWLDNIVEYAKEAYNNARVGNFISLAIMIRCVIENYVCACFIKRYEEEQLWEDWYINSIILNCKKLSKLCPNEQREYILEKQLEDVCKERNITLKYNVKSEYEWTSKVIKKKHPTFYDLCNFLNIDIYKDYRALSNFCHGVNALNKTYQFTFVESYFYMLINLVMYLEKSVEELVGEINRQKYYEEIDKFWTIMYEWRSERDFT